MWDIYFIDCLVNCQQVFYIYNVIKVGIIRLDIIIKVYGFGVVFYIQDININFYCFQVSVVVINFNVVFQFNFIQFVVYVIIRGINDEVMAGN